MCRVLYANGQLGGKPGREIDSNRAGIGLNFLPTWISMDKALDINLSRQEWYEIYRRWAISFHNTMQKNGQFRCPFYIEEAIRVQIRFPG